MHKKQSIKLNEEQLTKIVGSAVKRILKEGFGSRLGTAFQGARAGYKADKAQDEYFHPTKGETPYTYIEKCIGDIILEVNELQNRWEKMKKEGNLGFLGKYADRLLKHAQELKGYSKKYTDQFNDAKEL